MTAPCWVVFYHYLRPVGACDGQGIRALSTAEFAAQLDWLEARADIIGYDEFAAAVGERRGFARPAVLLTFDDGLSEHLAVATAELETRGLTGVFFVNGEPLTASPRLVNVHRVHLLLDTMGAAALLDEVRRLLTRNVAGTFDAAGLYRYDGEPEHVVKRLLNYELPYEELDRLLTELVARHLGDERAIARRLYLSPSEVREMSARGMTIGYHTRRHRVLSRLDSAAQREEIADGLALVRELAGSQPSVPFCYPYGHRQTFTDETRHLLEAAGYEMAFTTGRAPARPESDERFAIPRYDTVDFPPRGSTEIELPQVQHP